MHEVGLCYLVINQSLKKMICSEFLKENGIFNPEKNMQKEAVKADSNQQAQLILSLAGEEDLHEGEE